jgi:hypothetical protein
MRKVSWDRKGGPLAAFADGYRADLVRLGFTANSVVTHVVLMGQLSHWMAQASASWRPWSAAASAVSSADPTSSMPSSARQASASNPRRPNERILAFQPL